MTYDTTDHKDFARQDESLNAPPLCLVNYFAERDDGNPKPHKPPGRPSQGKVVERQGNLIVLAFPKPNVRPARARRTRNLAGRMIDAGMILLLILSALACLASFRF